MEKKEENRLKVCGLNSDWSKLCPDVLRKIIESLKSPVDSHRAKIVCSDWYAVWKTCSNRPPCPWRIIHQGEYSSTRREEEEEEEDVRKLVGLDNSSTSYRMASSGNWLLMIKFCFEFYIINLVTRERINLPSLEWKKHGIKSVRLLEEERRQSHLSWLYKPNPILYNHEEWNKSLAVLWIDETTGDYLVAWAFQNRYLFSIRRGDDSWINLINSGDSYSLFDMACNNNKLYVLTTDHHINIFYWWTKEPYTNHHPFDFVEKEWEYIWKRKIAIQRSSGEVLIILSLKEVLCDEDKLLFYILKMNHESGKWERVYSIGDEMLIFGHGVTVTPFFGDGFKSDSICFVDDDIWPDHQDYEHRVSNCGVFDIPTGKIEWPQKTCFHINSTQWLVPEVAY